MSPQASPLRVAVVLSQFPETHETFVLREVSALAGRPDVEPVVYSLKRCRDRVVQPGYRAVAHRVVHGGLVSPATLWAALREAVRGPWRLALALGAMVLHGWRRPLELAKGLAATPLALRFAADARRRGVDWVQGHWTNVPSTAAWLMARVLERPLGVSVHGENVYRRDDLVVRKLREARLVTCCTRAVAAELARRLPPAPEGPELRVDYHGLEPGGGSARGAGRRRRKGRPLALLAVGRLVPYKGFDTALGALARLVASGLDARLVVIGEGPERARLLGLARERGVAERLELRATTDVGGVARSMGEADLFLAPSRVASDGMRDGIPNVLAEAMAAGLPVIASEVSGIPELVEHGRSGWLVPPDDPEALATAVRELAESGGLAAALADAARTRVRERFDLARNVDGLSRALVRAAGRLRVVHVIEDLALGGGERALVRVLGSVDPGRFETRVICLRAEGALAAELRDTGVPVEVLGKGPGLDPASVLRLARRLRALRPDVVHTHMFTANATGRAAAFLAGVGAVVATEQSVDTWKDLPRRAVDRLLARGTRRVVCVGQAVLAFYRDRVGVAGARLQVIPNPVDVAAFARVSPEEGARVRVELGLAPRSPVAGFVGRLVEAKDPLGFVEAVARVNGAVPGLTALVVGEGPLRGRAEGLARELGVADRVRFLGERRDVARVLSALDCLVLSSRREGLPLVALEARAAGRPVVATDVGGVSEVVEDGRNGRLVPAGDAAALARALTEVLADPALARSMGRAGAAGLERYEVAQVAREHEALWREVARGSS
ncbi:MAG: glycosyltransferase [Planctomycetes bacterium]|nr:glycosyltransferase [Planctomycetota bacterium]